MSVDLAGRRRASADWVCAGVPRAGHLPSWSVVALSLILAVTLLVPAWSPNTVALAQTATAGVAPAGAAAAPASLAAANIDPDLQRQMSASPFQMLPIIVEVLALAAPFPPKANQLRAQRAVALLAQFGRPVGGLALLGSAAGFANAVGITNISLDPQVAFVHADSVVHPSAGQGWQVPLSAAYPRAVNADRVWSQGTNGAGIGVAVLDSGINPDVDLTQPTNRLIASVNYAGDRGGMADAGGHGTHISGIIAGNGFASNGEYIGIAPGANVLDVRVLNRNGNGRISAVVRGIEWALAHRAQYNIRLINLSLGAPARTSYRVNPLDAAAEIAWMRGVAVVAAAGNSGPTGNVDSPGDDPYVITVGATDDRGTAGTEDDTLATFSAWGTPPDSTPKPDVVAPGRRIVSLRVTGSYLDTRYPDRVTPTRSGATYFRLSGTSTATPVMTGIAALMLQQQPTLTPDKVKSFTMGSTQGYGWAAGGPAVPDPRSDGSGLVDAWAATYAGSNGGDPSQSDPVRRQQAATAAPRPVRQAYRPADIVARSLYASMYGGKLSWKDPTYKGVLWSSLTWTNLKWDNLAWDNLAWDGLAWDDLAWDDLAWDDLAWDNLAWDDLAWDNNQTWDAWKTD